MEIEDKKFCKLLHTHLGDLEDIKRYSKELDTNMVATYRAKENGNRREEDKCMISSYRAKELLCKAINEFIKKYRENILECTTTPDEGNKVILEEVKSIREEAQSILTQAEEVIFKLHVLEVHIRKGLSDGKNN